MQKIDRIMKKCNGFRHVACFPDPRVVVAGRSKEARRGPAEVVIVRIISGLSRPKEDLSREPINGKRSSVATYRLTG